MKVTATIEFHIHDGRVQDAVVTSTGTLTKAQAAAIREWFAQKQAT
jgi:hypothetical protein